MKRPISDHAFKGKQLKTPTCDFDQTWRPVQMHLRSSLMAVKAPRCYRLTLLLWEARAVATQKQVFPLLLRRPFRHPADVHFFALQKCLISTSIMLFSKVLARRRFPLYYVFNFQVHPCLWRKTNRAISYAIS